MKKIITKGLFPDTYEIYDDGTARARCVICNKMDTILTDRFEKLRLKPNWYQEYNCYDCWKKTEKGTSFYADRAEKELQRQDDIRWGQALNLAFQMALYHRTEATREEVFNAVRSLHPAIMDLIADMKGEKVADEETHEEL